MLVRFVSLALLIVMLLLAVTGVVMLYGTWQPWVFDLHRVAGWSLVALIPGKALIVYRSLRRGLRWDFDRGFVVLLSSVMAGVILLIVTLGLMWMWRLGPYRTLMGQTVIAWHWILGLAVLPVLALHVWRRWIPPRQADFASRRGALKLLALGAGGVVGWRLGLMPARAQATADRPRRSTTGSRGFGLFQGNAFPITGEGTLSLDADQWTLRVAGAVAQPLTLTYDQILALVGQGATEKLDCTSGWYTIQDWSGVSLLRLLEEAESPEEIAGVRLVSATGYNHTYPLEEAKHVLLATHVGGEVLAPRHGYPLRAVVPGRRGWFWVKWLTRIQVLDNPLEVLGGTLSSPRQVLRQF